VSLGRDQRGHHRLQGEDDAAIADVGEGIGIVTFMQYLGCIDLEQKTLQPLGQPVRPEVVTYVLGTDRHRCVRCGHIRRPRPRARGTPLSPGIAPNDLWCADFKGEFKLGNGAYCYPLTVTDHASRYLLLCEALDSVREATAITTFQQLFLERGLPAAIRSDNGVPFASPNALFNLSKLSVWWLRLGIAIERIRPGRPQQNGRHERMHLTLKKEATRPPGMNSLQQQARFDAFVHEFNTERPHEALAMKTPGEMYSPSPRPYLSLPDLTYPLHDKDVLVTACGRICMHRKRITISYVLAGQRVGIKEVDDGTWIVSFMQYDLGYIDLEQKTLQPLDNPFGARLLPMSPE
jgi:transposase InsO family protein